MDHRQTDSSSRREFLCGLALAGAAGSLSIQPGRAAAEPPPEISTLKLIQIPGICIAPQYVAGELLAAEGFTDVQYLKREAGLGTAKALAGGDADITLNFVAPFIIQADAGDPIVMLAGVHTGCFELFGTERIHSVRDLKGKTVAVDGLGSSQHVFLASMASYVGLEPQKDIHWVALPAQESMQRLADGTVDAFLGFPPAPQELRAKKIGHVVVNSAVDRPWSQYFCCIVAGNREFVRRNPVATRRALRAILKAADVCALQPERAARAVVEKGYAKNYDYALQTMKEVPYNRWRQYDPEDTVRFYTLRLREAGMIKATPQKIIGQATDWRFLTELKKELKG
jgi:NitT/TauT family transport system substrate-binding protein